VLQEHKALEDNEGYKEILGHKGTLEQQDNEEHKEILGRLDLYPLQLLIQYM
jgi:hypothetical protein